MGLQYTESRRVKTVRFLIEIYLSLIRGSIYITALQSNVPGQIGNVKDGCKPLLEVISEEILVHENPPRSLQLETLQAFNPSF